jgi:hypothetical protein
VEDQLVLFVHERLADVANLVRHFDGQCIRSDPEAK